jgi:putative DNA primase/helicase
MASTRLNEMGRYLEVKAARQKNGDTKGQGRPLELPEIKPWRGAVNGSELLDEIVACLRDYLVLPSGSAEIIALWVLHTHAFDCFTITPRLAITSPEKGCGKTTLLDVINQLVARPLSTSSVTTSAVFRIVEMKKPTLLIDEADTFLKDNDGLRGVLNTGHRRGGQVTRTVGEDFEPRQFTTWSPAAIAMIGRLPDTLDDRAITIRLRRRKPIERVRAFRSDRAGELRVLAQKAARWTLDNRQALTAADPETGELVNRSADNWRPLFAIADIAGGKWPRLARSTSQHKCDHCQQYGGAMPFAYGSAQGWLHELIRRRGFMEIRERDGPGSPPRDARWRGGRRRKAAN